MPDGTLLVFSPLNEPRQAAVRRLRSLHPDLLVINDGGLHPAWAAALPVDVRTVDRSQPQLVAQDLRDEFGRRGTACAGILTLSETGLVFCSLVAEFLGVPFTGVEILAAARDKHRMRAAFARAGMPTVDFGTAGSTSECLEVADRLGYPVVLKPLMAGGSLYVTRVDTPGQLATCFQRVLRGGYEFVASDPFVQAHRRVHGDRILVEQLIDGVRLFPSRLDLPVGEVSVEGVVQAGVVTVLAHHDKPLPANGPHFEEVLWSAPSRLPASYLERVDRLTAEAVLALGLDNAVFHAEFRTPPAGPVVLEVAARMGGGPIYRSARLAYGTDLVAALHAVATGTPFPTPPLRPTGAAVLTVGLFADAGRLDAIRGIERVEAHPRVVEVCVYEPPGSRIAREGAGDHCTVHVMVEAGSFDEAEQVGQWAADQIQFDVTPLAN